jgi:Putative Actinobacterial Holin-X, holin superfamily III
MTRTYRSETDRGAPPYPNETTFPVSPAARGGGPDVDTVPEALREETGGTQKVSTGHLVTEVATDISTLFRQEVALAKAELREEAGKAGKGMRMFAGAGGAAYFAALFALLAAMFGLAEVMAPGWAALIVAAVLGVVAAVLALVGRRTVRTVHPTPTRTVQTLREDVQWAQSRRR